MDTATCRTPGCGNEDHPIALDFIDPADPPTVILCGGCAQPITDVR
jgi:hypothetical protein